MASYNEYPNPYAQAAGAGAGPGAQYGERLNEDYSTPSYAHQQSLDYNNYGSPVDTGTGGTTPVPGDDRTAASASSLATAATPKGVGAEKPHPDDLDGDGVNNLGEIGGTARAKPGRAGLHTHPSSYAAMGPPPRSTGILRMWRKDERGKQWFRGGGTRSTLRLVCCCLTIAVLAIISIILTVLLYIRPPSINLNGVTFQPGSVVLDTANQNFNVAVNLSISVSNPNWFAVNFRRIEADVKYNNGQFGGGAINKVNLEAYRVSTFDFPFYLNYSSKADPNSVMIKALSDSCASGKTNPQITVNYNLKLWLEVFSATIKPSIDSDATIDCPLDAKDIQQIYPQGGK